MARITMSDTLSCIRGAISNKLIHGMYVERSKTITHVTSPHPDIGWGLILDLCDTIINDLQKKYENN